jgi:hypothetical protein
MTSITMFVIGVTRRGQLVEQELLILTKYLSLPPFLWYSCCSISSFLCFIMSIALWLIYCV